MGAFDQHGQLLLATARAGRELAFRPGEDVDDQPDEAGKEHQEHPDYGVFHAAGFGVLVDPDEHGDVEGDEGDGYADGETAAAGEEAAVGCGVVVAALGQGELGSCRQEHGRGSEQNRDRNGMDLSFEVQTEVSQRVCGPIAQEPECACWAQSADGTVAR